MHVFPEYLSPNSILCLPFKECLQEIQALYPTESQMLVGQASVSPESTKATAHPMSPAYTVFAASDIVDNREFDRAAFGLGLFQAALGGHRSVFPLSDHVWNRLRQWLLEKVCTEQDALNTCAAILFNDMGKLWSVREHAHAVLGHVSADHDRVFLEVLGADPGFFESISCMDQNFLERFTKGLETNFNLGKALQMECSDTDWKRFAGLDSTSRDILFCHSLFDMLGSTGAGDPTKVDPVLCSDANVSACLDIAMGTGAVAYRNSRLENLGPGALDRDVTPRLVGMARVFDIEQAKLLDQAWCSLEEPVRAVLRQELGQTSQESRPFIETHYCPALLANAYKSSGVLGWTEALTHVARVLWTVRHQLEAKSPRVVVANVAALATLVGDQSTSSLANTRLVLEPTPDGYHVCIEPTPFIGLENFSRPIKAADLAVLFKDRRVAFVGMGGGSDGLQATQVAMESRACIACVISVRSGGGLDGQRGTRNHAGSPAPGVYRIAESTTGDGRFLENLPAGMLPTYLVLDAMDGSLATSIKAAIQDAGGADVVVGIDTGGDALHSAHIQDASLASPDQDLRTLEALVSMQEMDTLSMIVAPGIDSPDNAEKVLVRADAIPVDFSQASHAIVGRYNDWSARCRTGFLGKTPMAWIMALEGHTGLVVVDLPTHLVTSPTNPWNPFVVASKAMAYGFLMNARNHLDVVSGNTSLG